MQLLCPRMLPATGEHSDTFGLVQEPASEGKIVCVARTRISMRTTNLIQRQRRPKVASKCLTLLSGSGIVDRVDVFEAELLDGRYSGDVGSGFRPVEMRGTSGEHNDAPGGYACSRLRRTRFPGRCRRRRK